MVADPEVIRDRESRIRAYVRDLREFSRVTEPQFLANRERQYAVLHALQLAVEAATDIATHICAADDFGTPASYAEAFDLLARASILDPALATDLQAMARFRNRIVHFYAQVDLPTVYRVLQERLGDFERFLAAIERYLSARA
jgi:uncharacterized protein YutE (UPF0331/DUF86 family)